MPKPKPHDQDNEEKEIIDKRVDPTTQEVLAEPPGDEVDDTPGTPDTDEKGGRLHEEENDEPDDVPDEPGLDEYQDGEE